MRHPLSNRATDNTTQSHVKVLSTSKLARHGRTSCDTSIYTTGTRSELRLVCSHEAITARFEIVLCSPSDFDKRRGLTNGRTWQRRLERIGANDRRGDGPTCNRGASEARRTPARRLPYLALEPQRRNVREHRCARGKRGRSTGLQCRRRWRVGAPC